MDCMFACFRFAFNRPEPDSFNHEKETRKTGIQPAPESRSTATFAAAGVTPIAERKPSALAATLGRIWTFLKYRSELEKAASDCRKFLDSLSKPNFELNAAASLCAVLPNIEDPGFVELFEKTMNETIKKSALGAAENKVSAQALSNRIAHLFDQPRKTCYGSAFRIAEEYQKTLEAISGGRPAKANWALLPKQTGKSKAQAKH